jgi:hypothetical protein
MLSNLLNIESLLHTAEKYMYSKYCPFLFKNTKTSYKYLFFQAILSFLEEAEFKKTNYSFNAKVIPTKGLVVH